MIKFTINNKKTTMTNLFKKILLWALLISSALLLSVCTKYYVRFNQITLVSVPFDVSKAGTVYETDIKIPYTGKDRYQFSIDFTETNLERAKQDRESYRSSKRKARNTLSKITGEYSFIANRKCKRDVMRVRGAKIMLKLTVTPLTKTSKPMDYSLGGYYFTCRNKLSSSQESIEVVLDMSEYHGEEIIYAGLELGASYHVKLENLNNVAIPQGISTDFVIKTAYFIK